ncbi:cytidine deaminase [Gracilibacillus ureilyticus]|uniref:Cytidine deaminase n=1 Tax=Gracilibacillus ureilyticus TaxID=531814 RepID=A0A1H9LLE0_9BACI|nr:cytidine deaminase [Gracilibacillus ureilyticus]SER12230.1 cytidine deaminase [Gracilibacillus ureilyticus]
MEKQELINLAKKAREKAYTPYSKFRVGAALLMKSGKVYSGCNIENAAYPVTVCAERTAIFKAISDGEYDFEEMAVVADTERPVPPCGSCRQVLSEFFPKDSLIHTSNLNGNVNTVTMEELLPFSFEASDMGTQN